MLIILLFLENEGDMQTNITTGMLWTLHKGNREIFRTGLHKNVCILCGELWERSLQWSGMQGLMHHNKRREY